jgi:hypothetical protein
VKRGKSIVRVFSGAPGERIFVSGSHKSLPAVLQDAQASALGTISRRELFKPDDPVRHAVPDDVTVGTQVRNSES